MIIMKAILFDLDRTLHDRDASVLHFLEAQHQSLNELQADEIPPSYIDRFIELECKGYVWKDKVYSQLAAEFSLPLSPAELLQDYLTGFHRHCREMDGASDLLSFLKKAGFKVGMITNGMTDVQNNTIDALGIRRHFDCIVISEEAGMKKPDPRIFEIAAEALDVLPAECLYVGDHYENDVIAARRAGMKTAWLEGEAVLQKDSQAEIMISCLHELQEHLKK
jgi:putative hydrolase of the HAD superfamily